jgi:hypothetical protein
MTKCYHDAVAESASGDIRSRPAFSLTEGTSMDVLGSVPLALGVLIALGGILVTMSYLSE